MCLCEEGMEVVMVDGDTRVSPKVERGVLAGAYSNQPARRF